MIPGEIHLFDIPFKNRPGSKVRPAVILHILDDECVVTIQSTSQFKANLELVHTVNFDQADYYKIRVKGLTGTSYFYREKWGSIPIASHIRPIGTLHKDDFLAIQMGLGLID